VYDTGSDWLVVEGSNCGSCDGDRFNADASGLKTSLQSSERLYGSSVFQGNVYEDRVCIDNTMCVNDFQFFVIDSV
jgi:hypothetical protein